MKPDERLEQFRAALNAIALREPHIDTMPLDIAFATLREVTKIARIALEGKLVSENPPLWPPPRPKLRPSESDRKVIERS